MRIEKLETTIKVYQNNELSPQDQELIEAAKAMTATSYAPYSKFHVGAAIRMADGSIIKGTCAERTAAYQASALKPGMPMLKIAIAAASGGHFQQRPVSPCGACRQALMEYEHLHGPIEVLLYGQEETFIFPSIASLLPYTFTDF